MTRVIWILAALALVLWTLLSWGTYALVTGGGDWLATNADLLALQPEWQYWLQWLLRLFEQFGVVLVWIVWGAGALATVAGAWLVARFAGGARRAAERFGVAPPAT